MRVGDRFTKWIRLLAGDPGGKALTSFRTKLHPERQGGRPANDNQCTYDCFILG